MSDSSVAAKGPGPMPAISTILTPQWSHRGSLFDDDADEQCHLPAPVTPTEL
jgi:hypothetical protein